MRTQIVAFDGTERYLCNVVRPDRYRDLYSTIKNSQSFIPRGAGLSYCAASCDPESTVVLADCFDRFVEFKADSGLVTVEAGVRLGDLLTFALSRGWYPPVLPGHPSISVGGSIAFNVHGKSQFAQGCFDSCVERLWLFDPRHGETECHNPRLPAAKNADIFNLTLGGMGLTGFIVKAELRLQSLQGCSLERRRVHVDNIFEAAEKIRQLHDEYPILYSWNNLNLRGSKFGAGVIYAEKFSKVSVQDKSAPFNCLKPPTKSTRPLPLLNNFTAPIMCQIYGTMEARKGTEYIDLRMGTFPINGKEFYFQLFGAPGFREYQMILPHSEWKNAAGKIQQTLEESPCGVSLGSLKLFSGKSRSLCFNAEGVCLSIDVPAAGQALKLFAALDQIVLQHHGVINVAKDSRISATLAEQVFPEYVTFREELKRFDPEQLCRSTVRTRLGL